MQSALVGYGGGAKWPCKMVAFDSVIPELDLLLCLIGNIAYVDRDGLLRVEFDSVEVEFVVPRQGSLTLLTKGDQEWNMLRIIIVLFQVVAVIRFNRCRRNQIEHQRQARECVFDIESQRVRRAPAGWRVHDGDADDACRGDVGRADLKLQLLAAHQCWRMTRSIPLYGHAVGEPRAVNSKRKTRAADSGCGWAEAMNRWG